MISSALLLALVAAPGFQDPLVLHADAVLRADGRVIPDGRVLLRGDTILAVGRTVPLPAGVRVLRLEGFLSAGMVDAFTSRGASGALAETSRRLTPQLHAADAVDPEDPFWEDALAAGVTAVNLVPAPARVVAGHAGIFLAAGPTAARESGPLVLSLAPSSFRDEVLGPTSLPGGLRLAQEFLAEPPVLPAEGLLVYVEDLASARSALELVGSANLPAGFVALGDASAYAGLLAGRRVALPAPGASGLQARQLEVWRRLHAAGVGIAFGSGGGPPGRLRESAIAFARATGDPAAALATVTSAAADLGGLGSRFGRLAAGARADLVLWSGHPLDASARVLGVMSGGRTVYTAPLAEER